MLIKRTIVLFLLVSSFSYPQDNHFAAPLYVEGADKYIIEHHNEIDFYEFLKGVKYAKVEIINFSNYGTKTTNKLLKSSTDDIREYLVNIGFEKVAITTIEKNLLVDIPECQIARVSAVLHFKRNKVFKPRLSFKSCEDHLYVLEYKNKVSLQTIVREGEYYSLLQTMFYHRVQYNKDLQLKGLISEDELKTYFDNNKLDKLEGIYSVLGGLSGTACYPLSDKIGIKKIGNNYSILKLGDHFIEYNTGHDLGTIQATGNPNIFMHDIAFQGGGMVYFDEAGMLNFDWEVTFVGSKQYLKLYPTWSTNATTIDKDIFTTGTGFAISQKGIVVTNQHVIEDANDIEIGVPVDGILKYYKGEVLFEDKKNDIAILQILDSDFKELSDIPYTILNEVSAIGESVFTLGYPLTNSMGENIKLTNGIISSITGYNDDQNSYQISAPINPGSSGSPLFDEKGNLIGIINAKHSKAENANYAIKSPYLLNLMRVLVANDDIRKQNSLANLSLPDQAKIIEKFVFLIKVR